MKHLVASFILIALLSLSSGLKADSIKWMSMNEALELNKTKPKNIFVDVYTSWCSWCKRMDTSTFENQQVIRYMNQNFHCVKFNAEGADTVNFRGRQYTNPKKSGRRSTHPFAAILLNGQMTYPSFVILDKDLRGVGVIKGYRKANSFFTLLKYFITGAYKTETVDEYEARLKKESETE